MYSSKLIAKVLMARGFIFVSQRGSHAKFCKQSKQLLTVILPISKKEVPMGTFKSILRQSHLNEEDFS